METVKSFFTGSTHNKDSALTSNQQQGWPFSAGQRTLPTTTSNGYTQENNTINGGKMSNNADAKRKDSDSYFYIMWRS